MKQSSIAIPGMLSLLTWLGVILGWLCLQAEWIKDDSADQLQLALLMMPPFVWLFTAITAVALWFKGYRTPMVHVGIWASLLGIAVIGFAWVALLSAFSDLASFG